MYRTRVPFTIVLAIGAALFLVPADALVIAPADALAEDAPTPGPVPEITPDFDSPRTGYDPKHTPKITAPDSVKAGEWFDVTIEIGDGARHPSLAEHAVMWIALYKDQVEISRAYLHPVFSTPKVTFSIRLDKTATLRALEAPNHTAHWETSKKVTVTE